MMRSPLVAGNWKLFKLRAEAAAFAADLKGGLSSAAGVGIAVCPPFTSIDVLATGLAGSGVGIWGQHASAAESGALTGEISMGMLKDAGATGVLLGHSERRQLFGETDAALADKVPAALAAGLLPVLCVGETDAERESGATNEVLARQVREGLGKLSPTQADIVVAYEPVWAIGTGKTATPELAQAAHAWIRSQLAERFGEAAGSIRILYGGSVKPDNAATLLSQPDVDGALVGGASLEAASLLAIAAAARR